MNVAFDVFESDVIKTIVNRKNDLAEILLKQYAQAKITSREFTGCGFYSTYSVDNPELKIFNSSKVIRLSCCGEIDGIKNGVGFVLLIKDGFIDTLEGYTYGDENWVDEINDYKLFFPPRIVCKARAKNAWINTTIGAVLSRAGSLGKSFLKNMEHPVREE